MLGFRKTKNGQEKKKKKEDRSLKRGEEKGRNGNRKDEKDKEGERLNCLQITDLLIWITSSVAGIMKGIISPVGHSKLRYLFTQQEIASHDG